MLILTCMIAMKSQIQCKRKKEEWSAPTPYWRLKVDSLGTKWTSTPLRFGLHRVLSTLAYALRTPTV